MAALALLPAPAPAQQDSAAARRDPASVRQDSGACRAGSRPPLGVLYVGNEGFLLSSGGTSVLFDAPFLEDFDLYDSIPTAMLRDLERARGAFAGVDLVLVTHVHRDHVDARALGRLLSAAPEARLVTTEQVADSLAAYAEGWEGIAARVRGLAPAPGGRLRLEAAGTELEALGLTHPPSRNQPVQHAAWLVRIGCHRVLHAGDTGAEVEELRALGLPPGSVDVAFLPSWLLDEEGRARLAPVLGAARVVAMHVPAGEGPELARDGAHGRDVTVFSRPGEERSLP